MQGRWRIELLGGGLRATSGDRRIDRFRTHRTAALFACLAYHRRATHSRLELVERFWPGSSLEAGRNNLRVALWSLRRQLEPPGVPAGAVLIADHQTVRLNPEASTTDVAEIAAALQASMKTTGAERVHHLTAVIEGYRGELLPSFFDDWVVQERLRLAEAFQQAAALLIGHLEIAGELPRAVAVARRAITADPLREDAHRRLIHLLMASGETEAARAQYTALERLLATELGTTPEPETHALLTTVSEEEGERASEGATEFA